MYRVPHRSMKSSMSSSVPGAGLMASLTRGSISGRPIMDWTVAQMLSTVRWSPPNSAPRVSAHRWQASGCSLRILTASRAWPGPSDHRSRASAPCPLTAAAISSGASTRMPCSLQKASLLVPLPPLAARAAARRSATSGCSHPRVSDHRMVARRNSSPASPSASIPVGANTATGPRCLRYMIVPTANSPRTEVVTTAPGNSQTTP